MIRKHYEGLKHIFVTLISTSDYPNIGQNTFSRFCAEANITNRVTCPLSIIDQMFIAANFEIVEDNDNPDKSLCRYEFMEIICRIADYKYAKKDGIKLSAAVEKLILEIFKHYKPSPWQGWREELLWNYDASDVFDANETNIKRLHRDCVQFKGKGGEITR